MTKRLKSIEEARNIHVMNERDLNKALKRNAKKSVTYNHNKRILKKNKSSEKESKNHVFKNIIRFLQGTIKTFYYIAVILIAIAIIVIVFH